jgi:DNA-binding beta-propeller fold protein YncE
MKTTFTIILLLIFCAGTFHSPKTLAQSQSLYTVDAGWPQDLPNNLIIGQVSGIDVAADDTIWVLHRPKTLSMDDMGAVQNPPVSQCCNPAPAVLQFSQTGELLRTWGGPVWNQETQDWVQPQTDWPLNEHGIFVDADGFVWVGGNQDAGGMHIVVKYTQDGSHVLTIGVPGETGGSNDTARLGRPADIAVDTVANEVYIADGYLNRRIAVFDSDSGDYKRHWGAYGNIPHDSSQIADNPASGLPEQFMGPVHAVVLGPDNRVYVADRTANRIQLFAKDGTFIKESQVAPTTLANGAVWDLAISPQNNGRWLFVADGANRRIWRLDRETLQPTGAFGQGGRQAGQFDWVHNIAVDSAGNVYTAEVNNGRRVQRFVAGE